MTWTILVTGYEGNKGKISFGPFKFHTNAINWARVNLTFKVDEWECIQNQIITEADIMALKGAKDGIE